MNHRDFERIEETDLDVAPHESDVRGWTVCTRDGRELGTVEDLIVDTRARKVAYLEVELSDRAAQNDRRDDVYVPVSNVDLQAADERVVVRSDTISDLRGMAPATLGSSIGARSAEQSRKSAERMDARNAASGTERERLTRAEEEVKIGKREVDAGEVRVGKHVETERVRQQVPVAHEEVHVERRPVSDQRATEIRASSDEIRVPITKEEVIVEKRPVVKEELVVSKERVEGQQTVDTEVRKERFDVDKGALDTAARDRIKRQGEK